MVVLGGGRLGHGRSSPPRGHGGGAPVWLAGGGGGGKINGDRLYGLGGHD
jgi:hypothetical protein